ncbi:MAG TPA: electron transfer flavoprotein subunit beta/FixA family protein [Candidatus Rifleibacterium sp.]|nr:electron transfer flavoprotein subunit beta/FixA family protein [Candidatus Rifleibacterium sp.]HPT48530.1 electron transfer flavoprotein subunit beta/FixA family protein [Candidatus Rifleibacterium sp.]
MKIFVCIKQVPDSTRVDIDPETMTLKRGGVDSKINPFDLYAIETAVRLKEAHDGQICAISMGPPQSEAALREAFMLGVDDGVLLSDRNFAGADVLATSYALSQGILSLGLPDVIICGRQTTDGDTGQVGPEIAEFLDIPHVAYVRRIVAVEEQSMILEMDMPETIEVVRVSFPFLMTVEKGIFQPRLPSLRRKMATAERQIRRLGLADLPDTDPAHYGLKGSPTQVVRIFPPEHSAGHETWNDTPEALSEKLYNRLGELKFL